MSRPLTPRQAAVLAAIEELSAGDIAPSLREIADRVGLRSLATVSKHVDHLRAKGYVRTELNQRRSIMLTGRLDAFATGFTAGWQAAMANPRAGSTPRHDLMEAARAQARQ